MRRIRLEMNIDCGGVFCGDCEFSGAVALLWCALFDEKVIEKYGELPRRCPSCLAAEVTE